MPGARIAMAFERMRLGRIAAYATFVIGGISGLVDPPTVIASTTNITIARCIAAVWLLGGLFCLISVVRRRLAGEYIWLRPLALSLFSFSICLGVQVSSAGVRLLSYAAVVGACGLFVWAFAPVVEILSKMNEGGSGGDRPDHR